MAKKAETNKSVKKMTSMAPNPYVGLNVKCKITGQKGRITAACQYITGCDQYLVTPVPKGDAAWYDMNRLEIISGKRLVLDTSTDRGAMESAPIK